MFLFHLLKSFALSFAITINNYFIKLAMNINNIDVQVYENKNEGNLTKIIADLTIGKGPFKDTYKSEVVFDKNKDAIFVKNIEGPLNHLSNNWTFTDKKNGITEITFDIDFEIKNKFLNSLMVVSFQFGLEKIADAFQRRAEELFGSSKN